MKNNSRRFKQASLLRSNNYSNNSIISSSLYLNQNFDHMNNKLPAYMNNKLNQLDVNHFHC